MAIDFNSKKLMKIKCNRFRYFIFIKGKKIMSANKKKELFQNLRLTIQEKTN